MFCCGRHCQNVIRSWWPTLTHSFIHSFIHSIIHSFIHTEHLYSASSRELLRGAPDSSTAKKGNLKLRKNAGDKALGIVPHRMNKCLIHHRNSPAPHPLLGKEPLNIQVIGQLSAGIRWLAARVCVGRPLATLSSLRCIVTLLEIIVYSCKWHSTSYIHTCLPAHIWSGLAIYLNALYKVFSYCLTHKVIDLATYRSFTPNGQHSFPENLTRIPPLSFPSFAASVSKPPWPLRILTYKPDFDLTYPLTWFWLSTICRNLEITITTIYYTYPRSMHRYPRYSRNRKKMNWMNHPHDA